MRVVILQITLQDIVLKKLKKYYHTLKNAIEQSIIYASKEVFKKIQKCIKNNCIEFIMSLTTPIQGYALWTLLMPLLYVYKAYCNIVYI